MDRLSPSEVFRSRITALQDTFNEVVVFVDDVTAEAIHWNSGLELVLSMGALSVVPLSDYVATSVRRVVAEESGEFGAAAVFLVQDCVENAREHIIHALSSAPFVAVDVLVGVSEQEQLRRGGYGGGKPFETFAREIEGLLSEHPEFPRGTSASAGVDFYPLDYAVIDDGLVMLPRLADVYPVSINSSDKDEAVEFRATGELSALLASSVDELNLVADSLNNLLTALNLNEDIFSVGPSARVVAQCLAQSRSVNREGVRASLVIVDRDLDLVSPLLHSDSLADRILGLLPRMSECSSDVCVDLSGSLPTPAAPSPWIAKGCLAHPTSRPAKTLLEAMVANRFNEGMMAVRKSLVDVFMKERTDSNLPRLGRVSGVQLRSLAKGIAEASNTAFYRHQVVQLALAAAEAIDVGLLACWDELLGIEKILLLNAADEGESTLSQLAASIKALPESQPPATMLALATACYSLSGDEAAFFSNDEEKLKALVTQSVLGGTVPQAWREAYGDDGDDGLAAVRCGVDSVFEKLHEVASVRGSMHEFRSLIGGESGSPYMPLLQQIASACVSDEDGEVADIEFQPRSAVGSLLSNSLGGFLSIKKPRPDADVIVVFVMGGVACAEVKAMRESVEGSGKQLIVVSGQLSSPSILMNKLFSV